MHLWFMTLQVFIFITIVVAAADDSRCCRRLQKKIQDQQRKPQCPFGFMYFKGVCYWFVLGENNIASWWEAKNFCRNHGGGNLVTLNQMRRLQFIVNHFRANFINSDREIKIYTGLVYTDNQAQYPYCPHSIGKETSPTADGFRWTNTGEYVKVPDHTPARGRRAKWSPEISGSLNGPINKMFLSCVTLIWRPASHNKTLHQNEMLTWRYDDCEDKTLSVICEVRLSAQSESNSGKVRNKRSQTNKNKENYFGVNISYINTPLDEHDVGEDDVYDEDGD